MKFVTALSHHTEEVLEDLEDLPVVVDVEEVLFLDTVLLLLLLVDKSPGKNVKMFLDNSAVMYLNRSPDKNARMYQGKNVEMSQGNSATTFQGKNVEMYQDNSARAS